MGGRMGPRREVRRQFWELIRAGWLRDEAGLRVGVAQGVGSRWFSQAGGVPPSDIYDLPSGRYLQLAEREEILVGVERGLTIRAIARSVNRSPSTVLRELRRNMGHQYRTRSRLDPTQAGAPRTRAWDYRPSLAQQRADHHALRPKVARLASNQRLHDEVQAKLLEKMSPEQISARLKVEFPLDLEMRVSDEAIYQSIYVQGRGALRRELAVCLRSGRALRKTQRKADERRGRIPGMVSISERPAEVEDRAVPGHWEGDLILGKANKSAIGTLVERLTRYVILLHLGRLMTAAAVEEAMIQATHRLPRTLWKTLTWDRGSEMANHARISVATGLDIYFCDPSSPWQRGSNENTNGLLRQYFPKGTDLAGYHPEYLEYVSAQLNNRPRKTLGWATPAEALNRLLSEALNPDGVASTG